MKSLVKKVLLKSGTFKLAGQLVRPNVAVLRYHSIQDNPENFVSTIGGGIIHSKSVFKEQMEIVARRFKPVTLDEILLFIKGEKRIAKNAVAITFDDGFSDNYEIAIPILNDCGIPAAFYVTVGSIETKKPPWFYRLRQAYFLTQKKEWRDSKKGEVWGLESQGERNTAFLSACEQCAKLVGHSQEEAIKTIEKTLDVELSSSTKGVMMGWEQIRKLHQAGHIIGSHTLTHPNLAYVSNGDLNRELVESKKVLEEKLGVSIMHFSYPSPILQPHWTENTVKATETAGYKTAVTCTSGPVRGNANPLSLKRIWVPSEKNEFLWNLECTLLGRRM